MIRVIALIICLISSSPAFPAIELVPVVSGLASSVYVTHSRDRSGRLFIVEQEGIIKILQPGSSLPTVFLNITSRVLSGGERGLLGLAFHPRYGSNGRFFVNYTRQTDGATVIAEYRVSPTDRNVASASEIVHLNIAQPFANHNGGMLEFGPDGFLYIATGDGGSGNDPGNRAQNINDLLGKMLRIDVDTPNGSIPYSSPSGNPFFGSMGADEIWAIGLRNPWRFSFDRLLGDLYIGDVGQGAREEVNHQPRSSAGGENYGWRVYEGSQCTNLDPPLCATNLRSNYTFPVTEYAHSAGRCSITGGYLYRGSRSSLPLGAYVYGDYCTGEIFLLQGSSSSLLLDTALNISSFGEDEIGEIYVVGLNGTVFRIADPAAPTFAAGSFAVDYDGDRISDRTVFRPATGEWWTLESLGQARARRFGTLGDAPLPADYDGDGRADFSVWRPSNGSWWVLGSLGQLSVRQWGLWSDIPVPGDYDGDGKADFAVWRPVDGNWWILHADGRLVVTNWGVSTDKLVPADYDGDRITDIAVWRPGSGGWWIMRSTGGVQVTFWGTANDIPMPADYDGDGKADLAVWRPAQGNWWIMRSTGGVSVTSWGTAGDQPVVGDYDGDSKRDLAIWRSSDGTWWVRASAGAVTASAWGTRGDLPLSERTTN